MEQHPEHEDTTQQRLTDLEIKASFTEDLLDKLDQVIVRQQQQIDLLMREVTLLRQPPTEGDLSRSTNARDELPPHY
ncbi:SlyX protein [Rhodoferax koreense]|uniref:SlyX protein n=1 Tax=Rhodoferax koreensis TaxID=1842727 RepID=A0A1P8JR05_9BURK|nr:SlyX family protein [Rhodoferax koreense]APW36158.1 SlyX protein [Rhodoferax koreense]